MEIIKNRFFDLRDQARGGTDSAKSIALYEDALYLGCRQAQCFSAAMAHVRVELAELLANTDPQRAITLLDASDYALKTMPTLWWHAQNLRKYIVQEDFTHTYVRTARPPAKPLPSPRPYRPYKRKRAKL